MACIYFWNIYVYINQNYNDEVSWLLIHTVIKPYINPKTTNYSILR